MFSFPSLFFFLLLLLLPVLLLLVHALRGGLKRLLRRRQLLTPKPRKRLLHGRLRRRLPLPQRRCVLVHSYEWVRVCARVRMLVHFDTCQT